MKNVPAAISAIIVRDLTSVRMEVEAYATDADLWRLAPGITNSGGTLALHIAGNLPHFIGHVLGGTDYKRNRDLEFSARDLPRSEVVAKVNQAIAAVERTFEGMEESRLDAEFPEAVAKVRLNTGEFMMHLAAHLAYHLGQLDYHRRLVTGGAPLQGNLSPTRLRSARPAE